MTYIPYAFKDMIGKKLKDVEVYDDKRRIRFVYTDGTEKRFYAEGDCCSSSWIEHLEAPDNIHGATITHVMEFSEGEITDDSLTMDPLTRSNHECLKAYQTVVSTTKGDISIEYRNSSNGYYGGSLVED